MKLVPFRRTLLVIGMVAVLLGVYLAATVIQVWWVGRSNEAAPADAIVVLGAAQYDGRPSRQFQARLDEAVALFEAGIAPLVVVTGGRQEGDRFSEAEAATRYLIDNGVPANVITGEDQGHSTWESLDNLAAILLPAGIDDLVLVSDPFHLLRVRLSAAEAGFRPATIAASESTVDGFDNLRQHVKESLGVAVGRLIGFERMWRLTG